MQPDPSPSAMDDGYAPWRGQQISGWLALVAIIVAVMAHLYGWISWRTALIANIVLALYAAHAFTRVRARQHGKSVEQVAVMALRQALHDAPGIRMSRNVRMRSGADIDVVLDLGGRMLPVEIKSYGCWNTHFFGWWPGRRERAAIRQARKQMDETGAKQAVIWLPHGRPGFWQRQSAQPMAARRISLVFGNANQMARYAKNVR